MGTESVFSLASRSVGSEDYSSFRYGFSCRRIRDGFTAPENMEKTGSYLFQEKEEVAAPRRRQHEVEDTRPSKTPKLESVSSQGELEARLEVERRETSKAWEERQALLKKKLDALDALQLAVNKLENQAREIETAAAEDRVRFEKWEEKMRGRMRKFQEYQDAGTCQRTATCALIEFAINKLGWNLPRLISYDIDNKKKIDANNAKPPNDRRVFSQEMEDTAVSKDDLFGKANRPLSDWNDVSYSTLRWAHYYAWVDEQRNVGRGTTRLLDYWRLLGYHGSGLREPTDPPPASSAGDHKKRLESYLTRAEKMLASELGLPVDKENEVASVKRVRLLCGVYVTGMKYERNSDVHLFSLYPSLWGSSASDSEKEERRRSVQREATPAFVPTSNLKDAKKVPQLKTFDVKDLQTKLRVLNMVLLEDMSPLPDFFSLVAEDLRLLGGLVRSCICRAAGLAIVSAHKDGGWEVPGTGLVSCDDRRVKSRRSGRVWTISEAGDWLAEEDTGAFDPSALLLGEEREAPA